MTAQVLDVCVVHQLLPDPGGKAGVTAIDKRPVEGPVKVGPYGLYRDVQADRQHHGGLDQAVYVYADEDARRWAVELGRETPSGWFGENLRTTGIDVSGARIGERWRIGEKVIVEVTKPRIPCQTFARWVGGADERGWVKRFKQGGRPGAYLRIVQGGKVSAGDGIVVVERRAEAPTIAEVFAGR